MVSYQSWGDFTVSNVLCIFAQSSKKSVNRAELVFRFNFSQIICYPASVTYINGPIYHISSSCNFPAITDCV